jgi:hypothetical protein
MDEPVMMSSAGTPASLNAGFSPFVLVHQAPTDKAF